MRYGLSKYEKETIINFNESDEKANIYTRSKTTMTRLDKLVKKNPKDYKLIENEPTQKEYECDKRLISFRTSKKLSIEQRKAIGIKLQKNRGVMGV